MMFNTDFGKPLVTPTRDRGGHHPPGGAVPGPVTYVVLAIWAGAVMMGIVAGVFAGDGPSRLALPASAAIPIAAVAIVYRLSPRFRNYLLTLDLRIVLMAQLWRVVGVVFLFALAFGQLPAGFAVPAGVGDIATGIAASGVVLALGNGTLTRRRLYAFTALGVLDFLVAFVTGMALEPPTLNTWPLAIYPTIMIPFFAVLHLVALLQSRHNWEGRVRSYIGSGDEAPAPGDRSEGPIAPMRRHESYEDALADGR
jgi:hypothetical protein